MLHFARFTMQRFMRIALRWSLMIAGDLWPSSHSAATSIGNPQFAGPPRVDRTRRQSAAEQDPIPIEFDAHLFQTSKVAFTMVASRWFACGLADRSSPSSRSTRWFVGKAVEFGWPIKTNQSYLHRDNLAQFFLERKFFLFFWLHFFYKLNVSIYALQISGCLAGAWPLRSFKKT